nr:MAG TPA: Cytosine specific methyltransferase [Caudoviricetes sp.]
MPDNVDKLFEIMQAKGAASDRDKFRKVFLTPGNKGYKIRKDIYDGLRADGIIDSPSYEDFRRKLRLGGTPTVNKYRQQMFKSVDPNKSRASELTRRAVGQAARATNNVRKPVTAKVVNKKGKPIGEEFSITPAKTVEDLDREYAQAVSKNWENELHDQMADADKDAAKISDMFKSFIGSTDEVGSVWGNMTRGGGIAGTPHSVTTNNGILENTENRQLLAASDYNRKRRELLQLEQDSRNGAIFDDHSFWRGMYDAAKDTGFLTGGASDLINAGSLLATKQDLDNGVHTEAGDMLMQQAVKNSDTQSQYGDNKGWMYTGGVITTNMAPFMVQIGSAGFSKGMSNAIGKVVQGAASKVALGTMEKATGMVGAHIANYIGKVTGLTTKAFGKAIQYGIVGAAQANTVGLGNVANDVVNRYTGQVYVDEQGNYKFGTFDSDGKLVHEGGEDFLTALVKGEAAQTIEFATELAGGGIDAAGTALKNFVTKGGKKIINKYNMENVSKVIDFLLNNKVSKNARYLKAGADRTLGKVEVNSIVGESLEEELGIIANTVFTGDNKISDLWDEKQQSQIWGGMLLSIGLMKGAVAPFHAYNAKQYYSYKHKLDKADMNLSQLLGKEKWEELRNQIDATTNDDMPEMVNKINRDVALGKNRQPVREYIQNLLIMRGYDIGNMLAAKKAVEDKGEGVSVKNMEKNQAYQQGRDAYGYDTHEIQLDQEDKQKSLAQLLGISEQQLASMSDEELEALSGRDDNIDRAIYDYQLSTARYEGVIDNARDQIDLEVQRAAQAVDMYTDKSRNTIRNATVKATGGLEDYGVYIINGNIATHEDGSIDISNSDDMILYYDPTTNTVEHADAMMFAELGSEENADEVRSQAMADAKEKAIKETTGIIDGVVEVGTQFKTVDADGTEHTYEVLADNGDGTAMITIDGNIPTELVKGENINVPVSFEELQKMKDASDQQRLQEAKAQREQMEKERAEQQTQPSFDFNQILNDNGSVVLVDVLDKDGNTKYPDSRLFLIRDAGAKAKVVELKSDGTIVPHAVNKEDVATISSMSLDEYKQAMPETSMIEDNSGVDRGGIEVESPTIEDAEPIGTGAFGNIYNQFKGKVKEAFNFLMSHKSGDLLGVFHRDDVGDIDLVWGNEKMGLAHILGKHVGEGKDFETPDDAIAMIENVINSGRIFQDNQNRYTLMLDGVGVGIRKSFDGEKKNWIVTAVDFNRSQEEKGIVTNPTSTSHGVTESESAAALNDSDGKDINNSSNSNENNESLTFEDGTPIPVDANGETDLSQTDAAHAAEWYDNNLGEDADDWLDGEIKKAKKVLEQAKNKKVTGTKPSELVASKKEKEAAIADAQAHYDSAISIRDSLKERRIAKEENTSDGRRNLIEKARRKFARLKSAVNDDAEAVAQLYKETVGTLLHRLYDGTGIDVTDTIPLTAEEYVASNLGAHSLNYEGTETSKGVKQETGLSREDFAKTQLLAADGKGTTIDNLVHSLWENRPSNLESLDTQEIRNALLSVITSGFKASEARNYIENLRIAQAENFLEEQKKAADNAAFAEENKAESEQQTETAPESEEKTGEENSDEINDEENEKINEQPNENINAPEVPEDATEENPFGLQLSEDKVPFLIDGGKSGATYDINDKEDRQRLVAENSVDDKDILDIDMPKHVHKAIKELCKKMGLKVQFLYMGARSNGWIENGTMYLALDTEKATQFVFGHEMTHAIKQKNPEAYKELVKVAMAVTTRKKFEEDLAKVYQNYYGISGYNNIDDYVEEVVADNLGKFINDFDLAQKFSLRLNHPVLATILHAIQKIKGLLYGDFYKSVDALERIVEKAYVDTANGQVTNSETGEDVSFSLRQKPEPKKKGIGYKVFVLKDGKLYPPMVANPNGAATPVGVWLDADAAPIAGESKTGRPQVKQGGKGTQGGSGKLAYRPGWHLGVVPYAIQFNRKDAEGNKTLFPKNFVFAEVEYAADVDYQEEARQEGINPSGKYQHSLAGLKHLPTDGYYMYRTNPNPETDPWVITGAMKVNRILTRAEQAELVKNAGREPQQIQEGDIVTDDVVNSINQEIADAPKFSIKTYHGSQASFDKFDHSFMGSGEGAQAYGWGTYVSEVEGIAKAYAKANAKKNAPSGLMYDTVAQDLVDTKSGLDLLEDELKDAKSYVDLYQSRLDEAKEELSKAKESGTGLGIDMYESDIEYYSKQVERYKQSIKTKESDIKDVKTKVDALQKKLDSMEKPRNLYSVDIPDDTGRNYIGWDEPLGAAKIMRLPKVFKADGWKYKKVGMYDTYKIDGNEHEVWLEPSLTTGKELYRDLTNALGSDKAASEFLSKAGFVGVKVIAQRNTGGNKEGKMNYVIFDENNAQITSHTKFSLRLKSAIDETEINPSDAQKESGNYKKGHIKFGGYDYTIENPKGSTRSGKDADGKEWKVTMHDTYGYIRGKFGKDGDHLDMFINDKADLDNWDGDVFVVDQVNPDGSFDEHKVMYGYDSMDDAKKAYLANYSDGWQGLGNITGVSKDEFDKWLDTSKRKLKPFADYAKVNFSLKDNQGNPLNQDGTLKLDKIKSVDELMDEDFTSAFRNVELPAIPKNVDAAIGANGKPVIIKKNIFEKNWNAHKFTPAESKKVLNDALYNTDLVGHTQPTKKPNHWVAIKLDEKSPITVLEVNDNKDNVEVVGWYTLDERNLGRIKRQAERNGGELIMLTPKDDKVESLSTPPLSSAAKIDNSSETTKENGEKVEVEEPKTFEEFLNHPSLKFSIKNEEQRKAAEDAYEYASKLRPNKYAQYALVDMSNPSNSPEYYEKKVLADRWRRFYNKAVHNELDDVYKDAWGNYKLFDLDRPFADQVNEVKGDVPSEFNAPDVVANKNADNESGAEYHEYKQGGLSSVTYEDRYKAFKQREANREKVAGLKKELKETEDSYNLKGKERAEYQKQLMKEYMDKHKMTEEYEIPDDDWEDLKSKSFEKYQDELDSLFNKYKDLDRQIKAVAEPRFSLKDEKTLAGVHNITEEKLRKALKLGGFANPSLAVIDTNKTGHDNFGEISFIAPSALLDKRTGNTGGTWITDAYTQRYPSVEREMSEKGYRKFEDWVDSLEYPSEAKAEIKRQAEDALSNNNAPAWELMYLKEKGIDIKEYDSRIDYRWKEIISDHPTAEDILNSMQTDPELNEKVTSLAKHAIIHPTWEKVSLEVRRKMYEETGVKASPINPQVRKQTKEIFERDYAPSLLNKNGTPKKSDVKKVVEQMVKEHNDTKKYDFYLSKVKASNYVNKNGLYDDFIKWQENKLDEFGIKNRIFRGYNNDGTRKYVPETLENVSKAMREEADGQTNGSEYTSFGSFIAKLASRVDSTDEMRANKDKLSSNKDKEEFYEKWSEVYYDLAKFLYNDVFYGEQRLHDIVLQSDPKKYAKKEYGITLTPTFMKKLDALKNAVQTELKSAYFETKYNRPLRLNEFAAAVVPDNLGEDVRKGIENAGLPMYDYDPNKEGDRSRAFNEAINSSDNIRFSLAGERGAADMAEDLKSLNTPSEVDEAIKTAIEDMPSGWRMANKKMIHIAQALGENRKAEIAGEEPKFSLKAGTLIKAGTYFSGGGLVEEGLKGIIDPVVAVEYDEKISGVYRNNFGQHIVTADVRDVDPKELVKQIDGEVEYFHASPVCKNYSQAKSNHAEVELDKETAASTAEFINAVKPKVVTIENVKGYKESEAMKTITDALDANGYTWDADVYNAADYGGYTNRERLIVRAVRDGKLPEKPKKMAHKSGWYEAVADIIPTLTEKKNGVAPWMDIRLKADGIDWRNIDKPLYVMGSAYADGKVPHAFADELLPTLRTKSGDVIVMPDGKVYRAMGRVLARVSGVSDDYKMPFSENLSHTIIGNGIPTQLTEHVIAPLLQNTLHPTTPEDGNTKFSLRYDQFEHDLNQWKKDNNLPKDAQRPTIPQRNAGESAVDFLRRVDEYRKQMALWKTAPTYEQHLLSDDTALGEFNRELQRGSVLKRIAFQDSMLAIRKAQEAIMKEVGVDRLNMAEDAYTAENRSHGKGKNEFEEYNNEFLQPLRKAYHQMKKILGDSYDNVRIYMMAKHGLERDAQMAFKKSLDADFEDVAQRSAAYRAYKGDMNRITNDSDLEFGRVDFNTWRQRDNALRTKYSPSYMDYRYDENGSACDYSGLSALFGGSDFEEAAHKLVRDIESSHVAEVQDLWNATNAATKKILRDGYKAGMMSKDTYQYVRDMYSHYIPLRGWDGTTADQVWDYVGGGKGAFNQTLKTAHGRTSIADDPIAYIENVAESGILLNNKNWVKQHLMLLAQNHPTSLLTLSKAWYVKSTDANGNEEWIPATPQITSQMNSNQVKAAIDAFEQKMENMAQTGDATQQREGLNIAYPQTHSEEREHEVRVMKDGEEYVIYVNGDPQLAQAMNNTRAHRVSEGIKNSISKRVIAVVGRKMAAAYTSLSPLFIPSNYFRDLTMTLASTAIREDGRYNYLLRKNLTTSWNLGFMLRDFQNGKLRDKVNNGNATPKEQMFYDFMMNGGETGFVSSLDVEDLKKKFKNDLKDLDKWKANPVKVGHTIMDCIEFLNRMIEDSNRFAVYMTSIQYGRSIDEAVNDAKDVTLNFNRKGTGEHSWQTIRNLYLFINPAVQSLQTLGALAKHHPFKFTAVTASWIASGVLVPIVNAALMQMAAAFLGGDGDDDKDWYKDISKKYWQFSKWDRRNNFIMWVPTTHEFVKIPLAQEFRAFYGLGDMIASKMMGGELAEESWEDYGWDLLGQVVDMLPLDPTGYDGNIAVSLMPNAIRPVFELAFNVDFTGKPLFKETEYNKYDPNFTKAYVGTPDWLVRASRMVNSIGNDYPDVQQNSIDAFGDPRYNLNNPAVVDHVLSSYLGGAYTMGSQVLGVLTKSLNDPKEIKVADIPLFSKFVSNPDDRPVTKKQGDEFWDMKENHDRAANTLSKLKKQAKVDGDYSMLERFYGSEEYKQYKQDDVKVKKYEEDKKKERAEESGEEYRPHKLNAEDIYKAHATPKDDFEDLKLKQLYTKLNGFKTSYDLLVDTAPSQSDGYYNTNKAAIDAIDEISLDKQEISELKKGFLDDGKDAYNAEDMKQIRELRKKILAVLEKANKVVVANQKAKAEK